MPENSDLLLESYDYVLPPERIAQNPAVPRDSSRLLVVGTKDYQHRSFRDLPELLQPGDLLVLNNTRVIPARLFGRKPNGGNVEVLLLEEQPQINQWLALVKPGRRVKVGTQIEFWGNEIPEISEHSPDENSPGFAANETDRPRPKLTAKVLAVEPATGGRYLEFDLPPGQSLLPLLADLGHVPLPPYIHESEADAEQYQTVYADRPGSAAAPTAGLHFTPELLQRLDEAGIQRAFITLHVGVGTFRPVESSDITQHQMHGEWLEIPVETVDKIQQTQANGGRVIAVGTTAVRSLEGAAAQTGTLQPYCGKTNLYIYPGFQWRVVEGLITNFHLPKSSLMMLVSALIGRQRLLDLYQMAIEEEYRFYSFGDAMLILPEARLT
ncbi:tRNA preQ1(34) S-adenosylmethionine ribosyltransferase-isomerase QueA [Leptolyngbya sp. FACHB-711]|uniref:tRNA preQ1(34) S-adenosylmethionine ribosyltransferase-isomerase QueA n=1 Tax=unclassified Leptolyngbya TaxID=2650499 RepID=UPI001682E3B7|nr:tRNA preQ1(34) S-adenosylmethionine ribosyltransferase-isomerase QueA [Leptolyngbya sp. FACHB-711]MBD1850393.1 tRNA preQ1(34) S-adenosylmethionine ribosyltransferase-isomerase QueA [Cyanobacteria bacterium FACHB-502]MBD2022864.1 tRNA preQ1(34) S-adenosylmethionine ribosyltransferase-isomerase QueA [Leptolyngbya sp. FACHB-711]